MFSTDKNIEKLAHLIEMLRDYIGMQRNLLQLNALEKTVRILTMLVLTIILSFFLLLIVIFLSFAGAFALSTVMHTALAFLTVAGVYVLLFVLVLANRKAWIQRPLVKLFAGILSDGATE